MTNATTLSSTLIQWERCQLFEAKDAAYLTPADLKKIPAEHWPVLQLQLVPAFSLVALDWNVLSLWDQADEATDHTSTSSNAANSPLPPLKLRGGQRGSYNDLIVEKQKTYLRLWRKDYVIYHQAIDPEEFAALVQLGKGVAFGNLCEQFAAAETAAQYLANWAEAGLISCCGIAPH